MRKRSFTVAPKLNPNGQKILACGDLHVREVTPTMRTEKDFFEEVVVPKITWVVKTANEYAAPLCIAGDIYDHSHPRYLLSNVITRILGKAEYGVYAVPGQHDMNYHSQLLMDTPYQSLVEAKVITNTHGNLVECKYTDMWIAGAGFGVEPPDVMPGDADVLLVHTCITENNPPFFLEDAFSADQYLNEHPEFRLIISGDYHASHVTVKDGRMLVNCGPLFRKEKTQIDMQPKVFIINVDDLSYEPLLIPIRPGNEAFDLSKIERSKKMGITKNDDMDTSTLQKLLVGDKEKVLEFPDVVSLVCTQFKDERGIDNIPRERLNNLLQRAQNG